MYTVRFDDEDCDQDRLVEVGGKNASLGELMNAGVPVPEGYAITTAFYREFIEETGVNSVVDEELAGDDLDELSEARRASRAVLAAFDEAAIPSHLDEALEGAWNDFVADIGTEPPVAVRSSATAEDLPDASFAGQQDTYLGVRGLDKIKTRVKDCMASLFSPRAIAYREEQGFDHLDVEISVGVQRLVDTRCSGVMFTLNPQNGDRSKALIEANWGLGESVVSGAANPDNYLVEKPTFEIVDRSIATKEVATVATEQGTEEVELGPDRREASTLDSEELESLVHIGKKVEQHYGAPQDIEWCIDAEGTVYVLQSRPETAWGRQDGETDESTVEVSDSAAENVLDSIL